MRVHRITIRDVKGVRESTVDFPESGVVIVEGPNEVGKSTLLEAFDKLLDPRFKATSAAREIKRLQPVGRDVGPYVEAEFTVAGHRVRYAKRWLRQPTTTLEVLAPVPEQLAGEAAHARLERLLEGLDRTLWDALRLAQSEDGAVAPLADSAVLSAALDAAAGSQLHAEGGDQLLELVEKEYLAYFTRGTGRPTGDYKRAMVDYTEAQDRVTEAHRRLEEATQLLARQEAARREVGSTADAREAARAGHAAAQEAQTHADAVVEGHHHARAVLGQVQERARAIGKDRRQRAEQAATLDRLGEQLAQTERQRAADHDALQEAAPLLAAAEAAVELADEALERAEAVCDLARADVDHLADVARAEALEDLVERVTSAVDRLLSARARVPARRVTGEELRRATELKQRVEVLAAQHEAASARVRVESLGSPVELIGAGLPTGRAEVLAPGERHEGALTDEVVVTVPGSVRVVLEPEADGRARREELSLVQGRLATLLGAAGVESVSELAGAAEATSAALGAVRDLTRDLESLLAGRAQAELHEALAGEVPAGLVAELAALREEAVAAHGRGGDDHPVPSDVDTARAVSRAASAELLQRRDERKQAAAVLRERQQSVARLRARLDRADGQLESLRQQVDRAGAELADARAVMSDEALEEEQRRRSTLLAQAEVEESRARRAVAEADVQGVGARLTAARQRLEAAESAHQQATAALHALTGQVEMAQSEGRRELYDLALAELDESERRLASLDRRARAARHLWRTLSEHRDRAHATYALPYTQALEELGRRVYGPGFGVTVDDQLVVRARTLDGSTVPFEELSGGAKEQLGILARLAVARLVDPTQGVPVVIDDALGYSDPDRLRQMGEVLGAAGTDATEVQVILLTCTPDRYAAVPQAHTVRLSA